MNNTFTYKGNIFPILFLLLIMLTGTFALQAQQTADLELNYEFETVQITQSTGDPVIIGTVSYKLILHNNGPDDATNIKVSINYHDEVIPYDHVLTEGTMGIREWNIPHLAAGATAEMTEFSNIYIPYYDKWVLASVIELDQEDPDSPDYWDFTEDDSDRLVILGPECDLDLTLAVDNSNYNKYEHLNYEVAVQNFGPTIATGVSVHFPLPEGMVFTSATATKGEYDLYYETWNIGTLEIGETVILNTDFFTLDDSGEKKAFAQVQTLDQPDPDSQPGNDTDQTPDEDDEATVSVYPVGFAQADLQVSAANFYPVISAGSTEDSFYDLYNAGPGVAPAGFDVVSYLSEDDSFSNDDILLGAREIWKDVAPGEIVSEVFTAITIPVDQAPGDYYLIYFVDAFYEVGEVNETNNFSVKAVTITSCTGDITFTSQAQLDAWYPCTVYDGSIRIEGNDITDLSAFDELEEVTGSLYINTNPQLTQLNGFNQLIRVGVDIGVVNNENLISINAFSNFKLAPLNFVFYNNPNLTSIANISGPVTAEQFTFTKNSKMTNMDAFGGLVWIGRIDIRDNDLLENLDGLDNVIFELKSLDIQNNASLQNINGLNVLDHVIGNMSLINMGQVSSLPFGDLFAIDGNLTIAGNNYLESLGGLYNLQRIGNDLNIQDNPLLSECCEMNELIATGNIGGDIIIEDNATNCNSINEILTTCGPITTDYCDSYGDFPWHEWISHVQLNTLDQYSEKSKYSDFTEISTSLQSGSTYPITLEASYSYYTYDEYWRVWMDYNQNGLFTDPGEMVVSTILSAPANGTASANIMEEITVPLSALEGTTRMRVSMQRGMAPTPCAVLGFGEVEDYSINITTSSPPELTMNCPQDLTLILPSGANEMIVNWDEPTASTTCLNSTASITQTGGQPNGSIFTTGVYFIEYVAADNCGNQQSCSFVITVASTVDYCQAGGDFPWHDWIGRVHLKSIDNISEKSPYSDFTDLSTNLTKGIDYPITLQTNYSYYTYDEYWSVWIDYNQNNVFETPQELAYREILERPNHGTPSKVLNGSLNIPSDAMNGPTRMRIAMRRDTWADPCDIFPFGEVEDYTINISDNTYSTPKINYALAHNDITLFPNPVRQRLFVNIPEHKGMPIELNLYDPLGLLIWSNEVINDSGPLAVNVDGFENGIYFLNVKIEQYKPVTKRFIVENTK